MRKFFRTAMCLFLALAVSAFADEAPKPATPIEALFQNPATGVVRLSPSGKRLAFTTGRGRDFVGLAVMELEGPGRVHWAARFNDADIDHFEWVGDERLVFTATDLNEGSAAGYSRAPGLYSVKANGDDYEQWVLRLKPLVRDGGQRNRALEWNHTLLRTFANHPEEVILGKLEFADGELTNVKPLWLNIVTGRQRAIDVQGAPDHVWEWIFNPDGLPVAAVTLHQDRQAVYWRDSAASPWRKLAESARGQLPFKPEAVDRQGKLYVTRHTGEGRWLAFTTFDFKLGAPATDDIVRAPGFDIHPRLVLDEKSQDLLGLHIETDAASSVWFDPQRRQLQQRVDKLMPAWINRIDCRRCGQADQVVLVTSFSPKDPGRMWLFSPDKEGIDAIRQLSVFMPEIESDSMVTKSFERIKARDGLDLPVWISLPKSARNGPLPPAVVLVHGGPWVRGGHWTWDPMVQFLASRGYAVIEPEFRGSLGYGERHELAGNKQWGLAMQDDVTDALRWAQAQKLVGSQACIMGASYGGYAVLMGLIKDPDLYRCGIEWVGVSDLELLVKGSKWIQDDVSDSSRRYELPERVGRLPQDAELIRANNPVLLASKLKAPLLMAYGAKDMRVPLEHGERMRDALQKAGRDPEWIVYPDEGHGWGLVKNRIDFAKRVERFLSQHLPVQARP